MNHALFLALCLLAGCSCDETVDPERAPFTGGHLEPQILPASPVMPMLAPAYAPAPIYVERDRDRSDLFLGLMVGHALSPSAPSYSAPASHTTVNRTTINSTVVKSYAAPAAASPPRSVAPSVRFKPIAPYRASPMRSSGGGRRGR